MSLRIVVLGATGQIGSALTQQLTRDYPGAQIVACCRRKPPVGQAGVEWLVFRPFEDRWEKLGRVDVLVNCIGVIEETAELSFERVHQGLTRLMLAHRAQLGNPRLIQVSVLGAETHSASHFFRTKALADALLLAHPDTCVVRPSIVCTPGTVMVQKLRLLGRISRWLGCYLPLPATMARVRIQPVMGQDLAEIISRLCIARECPRVLEVAGPEPLALAQLLRVVRGGRVKPVVLPAGWLEWALPLVTRAWPGLLNREQLQLLKQDNTADPVPGEQWLGRPLNPTDAFWREELR